MRLERREEIRREQQLAIAGLTHSGSALVLPHPKVPDAEVESIAMEEAMRYERKQGWEPQNVSAEDQGFDILSRHPASGRVRFIEVKGQAGVGPVVHFATNTRQRSGCGQITGSMWSSIVPPNPSSCLYRTPSGSGGARRADRVLSDPA